MTPRIAVVGAGGLGSKLGGFLAESGEAEVWLVHRRREHVDTIRRQGLRLRRDTADRRVRVRATTSAAEVGQVDFVLVLVKAYDTAQAARDALPLMGPKTLAITFQNGLGNLETLAGVLGPERCVLGVTFQGATLEGPGVVADMGHGPTYLASRSGSEAQLDALAGTFSRAGIPTELRRVDEVDGLLWGKLAMVAGINPVAAVLRVPNGTLGAVEAARSLSLEAIEETMAVARARGVRLPFNPRERFERTTEATASMASGTLLDAVRGRRTEVDAISGAIADEGERLGVPVPINRLLWRLVKAIEATHEPRVALAARIGG